MASNKSLALHWTRISNEVTHAFSGRHNGGDWYTITCYKQPGGAKFRARMHGIKREVLGMFDSLTEAQDACTAKDA